MLALLVRLAGGINGARAATFSSFFEIFFERNSYRVERRNDGVEFDTIRDLNLKCLSGSVPRISEPLRAGVDSLESLFSHKINDFLGHLRSFLVGLWTSVVSVL